MKHVWCLSTQFGCAVTQEPVTDWAIVSRLLQPVVRENLHTDGAGVVIKPIFVQTNVFIKKLISNSRRESLVARPN